MLIVYYFENKDDNIQKSEGPNKKEVQRNIVSELYEQNTNLQVQTNLRKYKIQ